jgi:UDP-glucose:(heptosyl)LPS alpha-1,3-glucosyltransferase
MKIGLVRRGFSRTGGAENYLRRLGRGLADAGHDTTLYASEDWPRAEWPYGNLVPVKAASPETFARAVQKQRNNEEILFSLERIFECDCYRAGDGLHRLWLERRIRHEPPWRNWLRFANRKHPQILQLEASLFQEQRARHVITNSRLVKDEIIRQYAYPENRITVIANGLPDTDFKKKPGARSVTRAQWGLRASEIAVLFAGSGWDRKGLKYAIQAVRKLKRGDVRLIVAGHGAKPPSAGSRIKFLGPITDMPSLYSAADLFILPTIYDPFSNACLEALSFGLPVITTTTNGFAEIIKPGVHGHIVDRPDNVEALADGLMRWADPATREKARDVCIELAANYTMERNVAETMAVLERL